VGAIDFPTGTSNHNVLDVRIERNTVKKDQTAGGQFGLGAWVARMGEPEQFADNNQTTATVMHNTV